MGLKPATHVSARDYDDDQRYHVLTCFLVGSAFLAKVLSPLAAAVCGDCERYGRCGQP